jgi:hypothetical protein
MKTDYEKEVLALRLSVPLFLRLFEYAKEESPSDVDLHWITERLIDLSDNGYTLTMAHYNKIVPSERLVTVEVKPGQKIEIESETD